MMSDTELINEEEVYESSTCDDDFDDENDSFLDEKNTEKFIVKVNNNPYCYTDDIDSARECMNRLLKTIQTKLHYYNSRYISELIDEDHVQIREYIKFFVMSYDRLMYDICIHSVRKYTSKTEKDIKENKPITNSGIFW